MINHRYTAIDRLTDALDELTDEVNQYANLALDAKIIDIDDSPDFIIEAFLDGADEVDFTIGDLTIEQTIDLLDLLAKING